MPRKKTEDRSAIQQVKEARQVTIRLESLTDMVFGLALSIGAVLLAISNSSSIGQIESNMLTFGFSFLILIFVWVRYTSIVSVMSNRLRQKRAVFYMNLLLLFFVAIEPYLFNVLHLSTTVAMQSFISSSYAIDLGAIIIILWGLVQLVVLDYRKTHPEHKPTMPHTKIAWRSLVMGIIFIASALPIFWDITVFGIQFRYIMWAAVIPFMIMTRNRRPSQGHE